MSAGNLISCCGNWFDSNPVHQFIGDLMKVIDSHNLPSPIFEAIKDDPYSRGEKANISVTELNTPPLLRQLLARKGDEIEVEAIDLMWALDGKAMHHLLERGAAHLDPATHMVEHRFYHTIDGYTLSGQADMIYLKEKKLQDYKRVLASARKYGAKDDWVKQLNVYRWLAKVSENIDIDVLEVCAWYKDWSKEKLEHDANHPETPIEIFPIEVWPLATTERWVRERIRLHQEADIVDLDKVQPCTGEDKWERGTGFAIKNKFKDRALKIITSGGRKAVNEWITLNVNTRDMANIVVEDREGKPMRCQRYCAARFKCAFGKQWAQ